MSDKTLKVTSTAFAHNAPIPARYTCDGENVNPPLTIEGIPEDTQSLVLIVDDPDAPSGTFTHWVVWDIPPTAAIEENTSPGGVEGMNNFGRHNYMGPCPPRGEKHRYFFKVFALDNMVGLPASSTEEALEMVLKGKAIAYGELMGLYKRP